MFSFINPIRNRRRRRLGQQRPGATAVEFAMVAPAFLIVITVCVEFSRMCMMRNLAQNACYEAARSIITEGSTVADGRAKAQAVLNRVGNVQARILINDSDGSADDNGNVINELDNSTQAVQAYIEIKLSDNSVILPGAMFGDNKIQARMTMRTERYRGFFDANSVGN